MTNHPPCPPTPPPKKNKKQQQKNNNNNKNRACGQSTTSQTEVRFSESTFLWDDPGQDQWSNISQITFLSKEPLNPIWTRRIYSFLSCIMIPVIREWKWGRNASRNCLLLSLYSFYYIILYYIILYLFFYSFIFSVSYFFIYLFPVTKLSHLSESFLIISPFGFLHYLCIKFPTAARRL